MVITSLSQKTGWGPRVRHGPNVSCKTWQASSTNTNQTVNMSCQLYIVIKSVRPSMLLTHRDNDRGDRRRHRFRLLSHVPACRVRQHYVKYHQLRLDGELVNGLAEAVCLQHDVAPRGQVGGNYFA